MCRLSYVILDMASLIGITETLSVPKDKAQAQFQEVEPSAPDFYKGPLVSEHTKPTVTGGTWFPESPGKDIVTKVVVLYLHGGAFVRGDGKSFSAFPAKTFVEHGSVDILFAVQYRLSGYSDSNPFPAALQDALTSYLFLLTKLHIPHSQIVLAGDSAGGNLAIALLRYIEEFGVELNVPLPRCVILFSPWTAPFDYQIQTHPNFATDFLPVSFLRWGAHTYGAGLSNAAKHPYITPLGHPFTTRVPIFVNSGTGEVFDTNITRWVSEMKDKGNTVEIHKETNACHDTFLLGDLLGFEASARDVASKAGQFILKAP